MTRTVPVSSIQNAGGLITGALWNAGPAASNTFLTGVPALEVYQATLQSIPNATWTAISQDGTITDTDGQHSNSVNNSRFICQVAGWYSASGAVGFASNSTGSRGAGIYKNGSPLTIASGAITAASNTNHVAVAGEVFVTMNVGDYLELAGWQNSGGALNTITTGQYTSYLYVRWDHG